MTDAEFLAEVSARRRCGVQQVALLTQEEAVRLYALAGKRWQRGVLGYVLVDVDTLARQYRARTEKTLTSAPESSKLRRTMTDFQPAVCPSYVIVARNTLSVWATILVCGGIVLGAVTVAGAQYARETIEGTTK